MYDFFKFLHVLSAAVWFGAGVALVALTAVLGRDRTATATVMPHIETLGSRLFGPVAGLTLIFGVITVLVSRGNVQFNDLWILLGFGGFVASGIVTMVANPLRRSIAATAAEHGPDHPDVASGMARARAFNYADLTILVLVIAAMVFKPTL